MPALTGAITTAPAAAYALTTSGLFAVRNADKASDGDVGRLPVLLGQAYKFFNNVNQNVSIFDNLAKSESSLVRGAAKVADFAGKNVNGLIVASSGLKVLQADKEDAKQVMFTEAGGLAGMFAGEGWMKKHLDEKLPELIKKISNSDIDINALKGKSWYHIIKGLIFVAGSIGCSTATGKIAEKMAPTVVNPIAPSDKKKNKEYKA